MEQVTVSEIFDYLENEHDLLLSYKNVDDILKDEKFDLNLSGANLDSILKDLFDQLELDYNKVGRNQIAIRKTPKSSEAKCGRILDDLSGENLAFANIFSADTTIAVSTNEKGIFELPAGIDEDLELNVSYIGFESITFKLKDLTDCSDKNNAFKIKLKTSAFEVPYLVIKDYITDGIDLDENGLSTNLKPRFMSTLPGQTNPDIMRSVQFLPGISTPNSKASEIYVRGGTPDQNLILWEDIPIYHSAHYFGMITAIDPFIVSKTKIYRSGFDASYGGRIACVLDIKSFGLDDKLSYIGAGADMINTFVNGHQKFGSKKNQSISFSLRRSYTDLWMSPNFNNISKFNQQGLILGSDEFETNDEDVEIENNFDFLDTHLKYSGRIGNRTLVSISGLYADNDFVDKIEDKKSKEIQRDTMNLLNLGFSFMLEQKWTNNFSSNVKLIGTNYQYDYDMTIMDEDDNEPHFIGQKSNRIIDRQVQINSTLELNKKRRIQWGYHYNQYDISFNNSAEARRSKDFNNNHDEASNLQAAYITFKNPISEFIGIDAGLRANYFQNTDNFYLEPRLNLSYQLNPSLSIHANYGKHNQFISQITEFKGNENGFSTELWALAGKSNKTPVQKGSQFQVGFIVNKNNWIIDLQAYKKEIMGLSSRAYNFIDTENNDSSIGDANVRGIDLLIKKRINKDLKVWVSYTLSEIILSFPEISRNAFFADYDQRHMLKIASQLKLGDFDLGVGFNYSSGLPYTIIEDFEINGQQGQAPDLDINYGPINRNHLNNTMEFNVSGSYSHTFTQSDAKAIITGSIINLFNRNNIWNRTFFIDIPRNDPPRRERLDKVNLPLTPNLSLRFEF